MKSILKNSCRKYYFKLDTVEEESKTLTFRMLILRRLGVKMKSILKKHVVGNIILSETTSK